MPVNDRERRQAVARIAHDVAATLGWDAPQATALATKAAEVSADWWDRPGEFAVKLAEDVQQHLHDTFLDPAWPVCPLHQQHPLWLAHDRAVWRCTQDSVDIAPLGALASSP